MPTPLPRRLPVCFLVDASASMAGEPIEVVSRDISAMICDWKGYSPQALQTMWLSVITFDSSARQVVPLSPLADFAVPHFGTCPQIGEQETTGLGGALDLLAQVIRREVRKSTPASRGDFLPVVFLMTDGGVADDWQHALRSLRDEHKRLRLVIGLVGAGDGRDRLKGISEEVYTLRADREPNPWLSGLLYWPRRARCGRCGRLVARWATCGGCHAAVCDGCGGAVIPHHFRPGVVYDREWSCPLCGFANRPLPLPELPPDPGIQIVP